MKSRLRSQSSWRVLLTAPIIYSLLASIAFGQAPAAAKRASALSGAERAASAKLKEATIRDVTSALSSKEMEGRGTAQPGGDRAAKYIADRFAKIGLKPLGDAGTYLQSINFKSNEVAATSSVQVGGTSLKYGEEFVVAPPYTFEKATATGDIVFVGYGVTSPALKRDDLAGIDVKGKIVVILAGHPTNIETAEWEKSVTAQSVGGSLIGRGAQALILLNYGSKERPYSMIAGYLTRRSVKLADAPGMPMKLPPILLANEAAGEKIFSGTGSTYAQTLAKAQTGEFVSASLNKQATLNVELNAQAGTGSNVVGVMEGSDATLKSEAVVFSAHYDAYGIDAMGHIFPGAADNALGVAEIISIAEALAASKAKPRRSIIFLAVTGEEYGLLGAKHWSNHPTWPLEKIAADINFDGIGTEVYAPVKRVVGFGAEYSELGTVLNEAAADTGLEVTPDPLPEEGAFYRSDHYAFVQKGVPAIMLLGAPGGETGMWITKAKTWMATDYHQPGDIIRPEWNWDGARTLAVVGMIMGMRVANADASPNWLPTAPFKRARGAGEPPPSEKK